MRGRLRMAQATGTLAAGETRSYVVWGGQGQLLDVRVDGVRGREILLRVVNARTGAPVDARAGEGVRRWSGRLPAGADYRVDLKRGEPGRERCAALRAGGDGKVTLLARWHVGVPDIAMQLPLALLAFPDHDVLSPIGSLASSVAHLVVADFVGGVAMRLDLRRG